MQRQTPLIGTIAALTALLPAGAGRADASYDICDRPEPASYVSIEAFLHQDSGFEARPGNVRQENPGTEVQFASGERWLLGFAHRTTILAEQGIEFDTNGYLHTFYLVSHRVPEGDEGLRISFAPALAGSSNVTKASGEWSSDAFQANLALLWQAGGAGETNYRVGLCGDHRFGEYKVYPVIAFGWRPARNWSAEIGYPQAWIEWQPKKTFLLNLGIRPDGNQWYVKNKALTRASDFGYTSWSIKLRGEWQLRSGIEVFVATGFNVEQQIDALLVDGTAQTLDMENSAWAGAGFRWTFKNRGQ